MGTTENSGAAQPRRQPYRCFLVRCWLEEDAGAGGEPAWRFTVQETGPDAARRSFVCLRDVEAYLDSALGWPEKGAARLGR